MGMRSKASFEIDASKCVGCGKCVDVCSGMVLSMEGGRPVMADFERFGWRGCWRCQHCLAVCPTGAISILGKRPEDSLAPAPPEMGGYMESMIANRRTCRRFLDRDVDPAVVTSMLSAMAAAPTGGNSQWVEYTVVDDKRRVREIRDVAYAKMDEFASRHVYTHSFSDFYYGKMKQSEATVRKGDLLFCGAPHLFFAHAKCTGKWGEDAKADCILATAYFELLCNAHGLGATIMSYPCEVLNELALEARSMLGIPADHYAGLVVGFGYPEIVYARGVQKDRSAKTHRWTAGNRQPKLPLLGA